MLLLRLPGGELRHQKSRSATCSLAVGDHKPSFCMLQQSEAPKFSIIWCSTSALIVSVRGCCGRVSWAANRPARLRRSNHETSRSFLSRLGTRSGPRPKEADPPELAWLFRDESLGELHQVPGLAVGPEEILVGFGIAGERPGLGVPLQLAAGPVGDVADAADGGGSRARLDVREGVLAGRARSPRNSWCAAAWARPRSSASSRDGLRLRRSGNGRGRVASAAAPPPRAIHPLAPDTAPFRCGRRTASLRVP